MTRADLIVLGAGPAGAEAAMAASGYGLSVALLDEQAHAGGQVWRAPWPGVAPSGPDGRRGEEMRARLAASGAGHRREHRIWSVTREEGGGFRVDALGPAGSEAFTAPFLLAATGAHERVVPFAGWTLPGVVGLAAATVLLKAHGVSPGARVAVAGCGPLLFAVGAGILASGAELVALADLSHRSHWARHVPALVTRPGLALRGAAWRAKLAAARVPFLTGHSVRRAEGEDCVRRVVFGPVDAAGRPAAGAERSFEIDALVVGHGLVPGSEVPRLMRAEHRFDRRRGGWVPVLSEAGETSVPNLFAAGDGAGLRGADPAVLTGRRVAAEIAARAGTREAEAARDRLGSGLRRLTPFSDAMADLMALRPAQVAAIEPETVICRCEDVTRAEIDAAIDDGAHEVNQLKHFTRCGMGPCQGRMCGDVAAELVGLRVGGREAAGLWTARPPLRPAPLGELLGSFSYADIPVPKPAPL